MWNPVSDAEPLLLRDVPFPIKKASAFIFRPREALTEATNELWLRGAAT